PVVPHGDGARGRARPPPGTVDDRRGGDRPARPRLRRPDQPARGAGEDEAAEEDAAAGRPRTPHPRPPIVVDPLISERCAMQTPRTTALPEGVIARSGCRRRAVGGRLAEVTDE